MFGVKMDLLTNPQLMNWNQKNVFVAGHQGMVGSAVVRALQNRGCQATVAPRDEIDLCDRQAVDGFYRSNEIDIVIFAAGKVGGILANSTYPAEFMHENLAMGINNIDAAYRNGVKRFLYLGSTCIYPRQAPQPMSEDCLLTGPLEKTNEAYALAKIACLKMCEFYRRQYGILFHSAMPTNLYGPGDNYHPENSHVLPALIRRFDEAKKADLTEVKIWGSGTPRRDFLHVDDLADALLHLCELENPPDMVNIGTGRDVTIMELAQTLATVVGYRGTILTDPSKPDGTPMKLTDISQINNSGWKAQIDLETGTKMVYENYLKETQQRELRTV